MTETILVDIDPTAEEHPALTKGIWLAEHLGADLELFVCQYDPYLAGDRFSDSAGLKKARQSLLEHSRSQLETLAEQSKEAGVAAQVDVVWDHPIDKAIIRKVIKSKPKMVVKDTHYHHVLKRTLFSNTDWSLIRDCPSSLLLVKPRPFGDPLKVMVAVDPMHEHDKPAALDHRLLGIGQKLSKDAGARLSVFHCFDPTPAIAGASTTVAAPITVPVGEVTAALEKEHQERLTALTDGLGIDAEDVHMYQGTPTELLPEVTEESEIDILVMGAVSRRGLQRIFVGYTAERVLDHVPCDLLIVKPEGFATRLAEQAA